MSFGPDKCPNCQAAKAEGAIDCAACGVVFAKWRPPEERLSRAASAAAEAPRPEPKRAASTVPLSVKLVLFVLCLAGWAWAYRPSLPDPPASGRALDPLQRFHLRAPENWESVAPSGCDGAPPVCWTLIYRTKPSYPAEPVATLRVGHLPYGGKRSWDEESLAEAVYQDAATGASEVKAGPPVDAVLDGLKGRRVDFEATIKRVVEVQPEIVVSEAEALRQLKEKSPGKSVFMVKQRFDPRRPLGGGGVIMQERVTQEVESRLAGAAIVVPARGGLLAASFVADAVGPDQREAAEAVLSSLKIPARPRPADGPRKALVLGVLGAFTAWSFKRLRS